jgi:hypothetical protein
MPDPDLRALLEMHFTLRRRAEAKNLNLGDL